MLRCWMLSCNSTQTTCYAAGCSLGLPHIRHATLLDILLHFHTYVILHCWMFSWTSTHTSCYAAGYSLALPHIRHSTLLDVLLHFHAYVMLRCWMCSCTSTWFVFESPLLRVLLWPEHRLWTDSGIGYKTRLHTHKGCRQDFSHIWKHLYAAVWRKSINGNVLNNLGQLCAWNQKRNFSAKPSANKTAFLCL